MGAIFSQQTRVEEVIVNEKGEIVQEEATMVTPTQTGRTRKLDDRDDPRSPTEGAPRTPIDVVATPGGTPIVKQRIAEDGKSMTPSGTGKKSTHKSLHKRIMHRHPMAPAAQSAAPIVNTTEFREPRRQTGSDSSEGEDESADDYSFATGADDGNDSILTGVDGGLLGVKQLRALCIGEQKDDEVEKKENYTIEEKIKEGDLVKTSAKMEAMLDTMEDKENVAMAKTIERCAQVDISEID